VVRFRGCLTVRAVSGGEESAGGEFFLRRDGTVWTTDKDGPIMDPAGGRDHRPVRTPRSGAEHVSTNVLTAAFRHVLLHPHRRRQSNGPSRKAKAGGELSSEAVKASIFAGEPDQKPS